MTLRRRFQGVLPTARSPTLTSQTEITGFYATTQLPFVVFVVGKQVNLDVPGFNSQGFQVFALTMGRSVYASDLHGMCVNFYNLEISWNAVIFRVAGYS